MSEPYIPEPAPEANGYHEPHPPRCPTCRTILQVRGYSYEGWCPEHGMVAAVYSFTEDEEWEGREKGESNEDDLPL